MRLAIGRTVTGRGMLLLLPCLLMACGNERQLSKAAADLPRIWEISRQAVEDGLRSPPDRYQDCLYSEAPGGIFVRLCSGHEELGCQGFLRGIEDLAAAARRAAQNAAFHDRRYPPATPQRLRGADLEITLIGELRRMRRPFDFRLGREAVYLRYHSYAAFMQPSVAREHGYTKQQFLDAIALKAGLKAGMWRSEEVELYRAPTRDYRRPFSTGR